MDEHIRQLERIDPVKARIAKLRIGIYVPEVGDVLLYSQTDVPLTDSYFCKSDVWRRCGKHCFKGSGHVLTECTFNCCRSPRREARIIGFTGELTQVKMSGCESCSLVQLGPGYLWSLYLPIRNLQILEIGGIRLK